MVLAVGGTFESKKNVVAASWKVNNIMGREQKVIKSTKSLLNVRCSSETCAFRVNARVKDGL